MNLVRRRLLSLAGAGLTSVLAAAWVLATGPAEYANRLSEPAHPHSLAVSGGWNR